MKTTNYDSLITRLRQATARQAVHDSRITYFLLLLLSTISYQPSAFSQGSLTPPGAPGMTMKTLDQIEARTPISSLLYTISSSGSYYLTKNVTTTGDGIVINASQVTLDLNGFTISSVANAQFGTAILLGSGVSGVTIRNGHIKGSIVVNNGTYSGIGFVNGINYTGSGQANVFRTSQ